METRANVLLLLHFMISVIAWAPHEKIRLPSGNRFHSLFFANICGPESERYADPSLPERWCSEDGTATASYQWSWCAVSDDWPLRRSDSHLTLACDADCGLAFILLPVDGLHGALEIPQLRRFWRMRDGHNYVMVVTKEPTLT